MKTITMAVLMAGLSVLSFKSEAQSSWDFQYSYQNVFSPNAMEYVVQEQNMQTVNEGASSSPAGVTYMCPIANGTEGILTQEFTFPQPTTAAFLNVNYIYMANFGGGNYGNGSLWASPDGQNWQQLLNAPTPSDIAAGYIYDANLPASLLGSTQIWIQVQLETSGEDILAQYLRSWSSDQGFELDANYATAVPESSTVSLFGIGLVILAFLSKGIQTSIA
jgi:hypothetical protein